MKLLMAQGPTETSQGKHNSFAINVESASASRVVDASGGSMPRL